MANRRSNGGMTHAQGVELLASFGGRCRQRRLALGFNVPELARAVDLSTASVANIERNAQGPVNILTLVGLRRALDCSADWLLDPGFYTPTTGPMPVVVRAGDGLPRCVGYAAEPREVSALLRQVADVLDREWLTDRLSTTDKHSF